MEIKKLTETYYEDQNARSGTGANVNTLWQDLKNAGIKIELNWSILDIGCRNAANLNNLWKQGYKNIFGVDIGELAERDWKKMNLPFINNLIKADIHTIEFEDESFDLITISHTLEHLYNPQLVLEVMTNALKPEGFLHSIVPIEPEWDFRKYDPHLVRFESHQDHINFYSNLKLVYQKETQHNNSIVIVQK
jgi:2-polyprenyl-3-methyl-5-hydroxy-6-metoxy-1,4-benzoquinol methylase